ncbi:cupin domain-containing protein [Stappia indica]|uniref:cupin domain-containing protein n=1 Tax=Stappia indica TaxID=538381 RepID=UPI0008294EEA|nr:cupin domain-containing protein [Stappia indica]
MTDTASASALGAAMAVTDRTPAGLTLARLEGLELMPAPINPDWVLEGAPQARAVQLASGQDRNANMSVWDCTDGRFNWYFGCDEAVYILEGSVTVTGPDGEVRKLTAGDTAYFPAFTWFEWQVHGYVRKVAFCHDVVPPLARLPLRIYARLSRIKARLYTAAFGSPAHRRRRAS